MWTASACVWSDTAQAGICGIDHCGFVARLALTLCVEKVGRSTVELTRGVRNPVLDGPLHASNCGSGCAPVTSIYITGALGSEFQGATKLRPEAIL